MKEREIWEKCDICRRGSHTIVSREMEEHLNDIHLKAMQWDVYKEMMSGKKREI